MPEPSCPSPEVLARIDTLTLAELQALLDAAKNQELLSEGSDMEELTKLTESRGEK